ncbi:hypothetical protein [Microseira wollei]|uniref:HNH nuclease domain-containing protein n=1 Tax=Microseira wollei NIES-4236 TaxID=2530354 RepID=A0AAV3X4Z1_9CYAN|nr:hypothetical protein [Microseira wollei]GET36256.1 hypothetical protein MiSe_10040 [Microseira wollei NIES-4236]
MASPSEKGAKRLADRNFARLGIHKSYAQRKLVKMILFEYVKNAGDNICWQWGEKITEYDEFSVEHKQQWSSAENPQKAYFDFDNIAFSHRACNIQKIRNSPHKRKLTAFDTEIAKDRLKRNPSGFRYVRIYEHKGIVKYMARVPLWQGGKRLKDYFGKARENPIDAAYDADAIMVDLYGEKAITNQKLGLIPPRQGSEEQLL